MRSLYQVALCSLVVFCPTVVQAQTVIQRTSGGTVIASPILAAPATTSAYQEPATVILSDGTLVSADAVDATATTTTAPAIVPRTRLEAVNELQVDRRPSAILEKWSKLPTESQSQPQPPSPLGAEMLSLEYNLTMSRWERVGEYLADLEDDEASEIYQLILAKLVATSSPVAVPHPAGRAYVETNLMSIDDVLSLIKISPKQIEDSSIPPLASMLRQSLEEGNTLTLLVDGLDSMTQPGERDTSSNLSLPISRRQAANLLSQAGLADQIARFLPTMESAIADDDAEALNLLAEHFLALANQEKDTDSLEKAWSATQAVLASRNSDVKVQQEALAQAVALSSRVRDELGQAWLDASFSDNAERGMRMLATVGKMTSQGLMSQPTDPNFRQRSWELLSTAIDAMLKVDESLADKWRSSLNLLALSWLDEAKLSYDLDQSSSRGPSMRYDNYGNPYFMDDNQLMMMQQARQNRARPISTGDLIKLRPSDAWISRLDVSLQPTFAEWYAKLYLKLDEPENAFPYIEQLATDQPKIAKVLIDEFLRVWAQTHDPNSARRMTSPIFAIYGFSQRAEGIPLTRSKQERNLQELTQWVSRLRALPLEDGVDTELLVQAFTICHSSAEVYDLKSIRQVFGELETLDPTTLAGLAQQMRSNLSTLWRDPAVQKQAQTNRRKKDIEDEVLRGYFVANQVVKDGLEKHTNHWALLAAGAALQHDEITFQQDLEKNSSYIEKRRAALKLFEQAAHAYIEQFDSIAPEEESVTVFQLWFYASLGSCDVSELDADKLSMRSEPPKIRETIASLPPEAAKRHMDLMANDLFTTLRSVNPAVKFRYLQQGFEIVGDHPQAEEARKVYDYYDDLVTEIELDTVIDGSSNVSLNEPFGVFVNLRHTREIEKESGGFGRYLQNQNNVQYAYNYGRPTENYRDKFEGGVREALGEQFEVLSVTFQSEDVSSKADKKYGWRITPYAYLLLKPRSKSVDQIPPMRIDLDFLDSSGYVVLPVESPIVPIAASESRADQRPAVVTNLTQTLDERQAKEGKLILEIKATSQGVTPQLDDLVQLNFSQFEVADVEDQGVSVSHFDPESDETAIVCERIWTVTLQGRKDLEELPSEFSFASTEADVRQVSYQRFVDADLAEVEQTIPLEERYGSKDRSLLWLSGGAIVVVSFALIGFMIVRSRRPEAVATHELHLPDPLTPFSAIAMLREIEQSEKLSAEKQSEIESDIHQLETAYFSPKASGDIDTKKVAEHWLRQAKRSGI